MMYERKIFKQTGISRIKSKQFLRRFNERKREFLKRTMKRTLRKYLGRMSFPLVIIITMMILKERSVE